MTLQDRLTQCREDRRAGEFDGDVALVEERIDFDDLEGTHSAVGGDYARLMTPPLLATSVSSMLDGSCSRWKRFEAKA